LALFGDIKGKVGFAGERLPKPGRCDPSHLGILALAELTSCGPIEVFTKNRPEQ